jgi:predicted nucleic acid-binding Zn ribbon protein
VKFVHGIVPESEHLIHTSKGRPYKRFDYVDRNGLLHLNVTPTVVAVLEALTDDWHDIDEIELPADVFATTESARLHKLRSAAMRLANADVLDIQYDAEDRPVRACREGSFFIRLRPRAPATETPDDPTKTLIEAAGDMIRRHMPEEDPAVVMVEFANAWAELIAKRQGWEFDQGDSPLARNCTVCGHAFIPQNRRQKQCNERCARERQKNNDRLMRATFTAAKELNLIETD